MSVKPVPSSSRRDTIVEYADQQNRKVKLSVQIVREFFCPKANDLEAITFIQMCRLLRANPWLRQIYLIKYDDRSPAQIVVSRDFFLRLVTSKPNFRGMRSGVIILRQKSRVNEKAEALAKEIEQVLEGTAMEGMAVTRLGKVAAALRQLALEADYEIQEIEGAFVPPGWELYGGWCEILLHNPDNPSQPIVIKQKVMLSEYNKQQATWKQIPATMIQCVAERQAARKAFADISVYGPEELGIPVNEHLQPIPALQPPAAEASPLSDGDGEEVVETEGVLSEVTHEEGGNE